MACEHRWDRARICSRCGYVLRAWRLDDGAIYVAHIGHYLTDHEARQFAEDLALAAATPGPKRMR